MALLEFVEDLWDLQPSKDVLNAELHGVLVAQTSGGVLNAVDSFANMFCAKEEVFHINEVLEARSREELGEGMLTFKREFLGLSQMLECGGLIVIVVSRGSLVKYVGTWKCGALAPCALYKEGARDCFERGMVAVVVNPEAGFVKAIYRQYPGILRLAAGCTGQEDPAPPVERPKAVATVEKEEEPSLRVREMRALICAARVALRPETSAQSPTASV